MAYFVSEGDAFSNMNQGYGMPPPQQQQQQQQQDYGRTQNYGYQTQNNEETNAVYQSPLSSKTGGYSSHYNNNGSTPRRPKYKPPPKTPYNGFCEVCDTKLNSYQQSKSHYEGKVHARKVKAKQEPQTTTEGVDEPPNKKAKTATSDVTSLYCGACNLTFTSESHAKDHYLGRNHARVLHGLAPYTQGYYNNSTNKWQRTPPDPRVAAQLLASEPPTDLDGKPAHQDKPKLRGKFHCEVCNCSLTCEQQQAAHLSGTRHAKSVKRVADAQAVSDGAPAPGTEELRCEVCNVVSNSAVQYQQHIESKKHSQKLESLQEGGSSQEQQNGATQQNGQESAAQ